MANEIKFNLEIDAEKGTAKVKSVAKEIKGLNKSTKDTASATKSMGSALGSISFTHIAAGAATIYGLVSAIGSVTGAIGGWIELSNIQAESEAKLAAVLESTGHAAGFTLGQLKVMASEFQNVTAIGDEVTISGMAILATFKNIKGDAFERTTQAALNMSTVMGQDLKSSMVMLGKAMNDPIANLSALSRTGVQFTEDQKTMIKELVESGELMEAQGIILEELESQFGGAAAAVKDTFQGALEGAKGALGDMKEKLGDVITKNNVFVNLVKRAEEQFVKWGEAIENNQDQLQELAKDGVVYMIDKVILLIRTINVMHDILSTMALMATGVIAALAMALDGLAASVRFLLLPLDLLLDGLEALGIIESNPFDNLQAATKQFAVDAVGTMSEISLSNEKAGETYAALVKKVEEAKEVVKNLATDIEKEKVITVIDNATGTVNKIQDAVDNMKGKTLAIDIVYNKEGGGGTINFPEAESTDSSNTGSIDEGGYISFAQGTGMQGLPYTGMFMGHQGEIVKNPAESEAERKGNSGNTYNITISPTFMTGDRVAARNCAVEIQRELTALSVRR